MLHKVLNCNYTEDGVMYVESSKFLILNAGEMYM